MRYHAPLLALLVLLLNTVVTSPVSANPSSKEPSRPLAAHGTIEGAKELVSQLYQLYDEEAKFVDQTYARKDDPTRFSDRQIAKSAGRLWKARRDAKRLQIMGEPAGHDLYRKLQLLASEVYKFGQAYRGTPRGNQLAQRIQVKLGRERLAMQRFLQQAESALQQEKLDVFETQMEKKGQELTEQLVFFNAAESRPFDEQFNAILGRGDGLLEKKRNAEYAQQVSALITKELAGVHAFPDEARRIAREIAANGMAELLEGTKAGPVESLTYIGSQWGAHSAALIRANALQWAFPASRDTELMDVAELKEIALTSLAGVIQATARSISKEDVQEVYCGMLEATSVIERRAGIMSQEVGRACREGLDVLATVDPTLPARVSAYERATAEVLRWRKAYASQQATHLGRNVSRASAVLNRKGKTEIKIRPPYARSPFRETVAAPNLFSDPADWMVQEAAARLVGEAIIEDRVVRLSPTGNVAVIPYSHSHYANLPVPLPTASQVSDLLTALVVDDTHRPLTITAANAVSAANMQDYETVMARIDAIHLESIVTRMIGLPDAAYSLVNLGNSVVLNDQVTPIEQTCWRLDLRPLWARHLYFIVRVADTSSR